MAEIQVANAGLTTLAMTQGISSFSMFLPRITEVRKITARDKEAIADVRTAEAAGIVVCFAVGGVCSWLTRSPAPAVISFFTALVIVSLYESVLRADPRNTAGATNVVDMIRR